MKKHVKFLLCLVIAFTMVFAFAACGNQGAGGGGGGAAAGPGGIDASDDLYIGVYAASAIDYFYDHKLGVEQFAKDYGVKTEFLGPTDYDMSAVVATMDQSIARKPDGIAIIGWEESLIPSIDKAIAAGIPTVTMDADLPDSKRICFVGTGNYAAGKLNGQAMADLLGGQGTVALVGMVTLSNISARMDGCRDVFANYPGIEIVDTITTEADETVAATNTAALLQKFPNLDGICTLDGTSPGVATAVREAGKAGQIKIVAFDRGENVLEAIEEDWITATVVQQTALMPWYSFLVCYNLKHFPVSMSSDNEAAGVSGVPGDIDTGVILVNKDNVKYFKR